MERDAQQIAHNATDVMRQMNEAIIEMAIAFRRAYESVADTIRPIVEEYARWVETEKRAVLFARLPKFLPLRVRTWIADTWPRRFLPRLFFETKEKTHE